MWCCWSRGRDVGGGAHVLTFPFSNVEVLLGHYPGTVFDQLVVRRRGGYCFERAQLFAAALETAGFTVRRALGRVRSLQSARTHMTVLVDLAGVRYLCDPGSGFSITGPVPLQDGARHVDTGQTFAVGRVYDLGGVALGEGGGAAHRSGAESAEPVR